MLLEAEKEAVERLRLAPQGEKQLFTTVADRLIELYTALDKPDDVKKWQAKRAKQVSAAPR